MYADRVGGNNGGGTTPVTNSAITPVTAEFDRKADNQVNIPVTLTLNGNTLVSIRNGNATLVSGTDYTLTGNEVVLSKNYLASLPNGAAALTFQFSAGAHATLNLLIKDTTAAPAGTIRIEMFNRHRQRATPSAPNSN
ncbi:Xyloglucanase precursor [compost metagenome]